VPNPFFSLTTKLVIAFLTIALVPVGVLSFLNQRNLQQTLTTNADTNLAVAAFQTASTIDVFVQMNVSLIETMAKLPMIVKFMATPAAKRPGTDELRNITKTLRNQNKYLTAYILLDDKGNMVTGQDYFGLSGENQANQDYFQQPKQTGQSFVSGVRFNATTAEWSWFFSAPVHDLLGNVIGVLYLRYNAEILQELVAPSLNLAGEGAFPFLVDENRLYLAGGAQTENYFQPLSLSNIKQNSSQPITSPRFFTSAELSADHSSYRLAVISLKSRPWLVLFAQPETTFLAPIQAQNRLTLSLIMVLVAIVTVMAVVIGQYLARPLIHLTQQVTEFTQGQLEVRAQVTSQDERGILAASFNLMAEQVGNLLKQSTQYAQELEQYRDQLELLVAKRTSELVQARDTAEKASQAKSTFLANVSHELRTPLTSILGFTKMIQRRLDEKIFPLITTDDVKVRRAQEQISQNITIIIMEGGRLTQLINEVLDLAKIEAAQIGWQHQICQVEEIVQRAVAATTALFIDKPLELVVNIPPDLPTIQGDFNRLIQVMINLLSNAVKFTSQGHIICQVEWSGGHELIIQVADTGVGIAAEDQAKIFEKFEQVGDTLTDKPHGTGLGLSICKEIVTHHGGRIWVESEVGQGSRFFFTLPC